MRTRPVFVSPTSARLPVGGSQTLQAERSRSFGTSMRGPAEEAALPAEEEEAALPAGAPAAEEAARKVSLHEAVSALRRATVLSQSSGLTGKTCFKTISLSF